MLKEFDRTTHFRSDKLDEYQRTWHMLSDSDAKRRLSDMNRVSIAKKLKEKENVLELIR